MTMPHMIEPAKSGRAACRKCKKKIEKGQRVSVAGTLDHDFFSGRELMASTIITLSPMVGS